jgi:hypothetical protein
MLCCCGGGGGGGGCLRRGALLLGEALPVTAGGIRLTRVLFTVLQGYSATTQ